MACTRLSITFEHHSDYWLYCSTHYLYRYRSTQRYRTFYEEPNHYVFNLGWNLYYTWSYFDDVRRILARYYRNDGLRCAPTNWFIALFIWGVFFNSAPSGNSQEDEMQEKLEFAGNIDTPGTSEYKWYHEEYLPDNGYPDD